MVKDSGDILERVLSNTYSMSDAYRRLLVLEDMLQRLLFKEDQSPSSVDEILHNQYETQSERASGEAVAAWGTPLFDRFSKENLHLEMQTLKSTIEALPRLVLYVPILFDAKHIEEIGKWCRTHIDQRLLLDLRVDPQAAGGCIIVWHDTLHDFSLRYFMQKRKAEFEKILEEHTRMDTGTAASHLPR